MQLTRLMVPESKWGIKCPHEMEAEGFAIHNTANKASAMSEGSYMVGNNNKVSFHYVIDDTRIVQCIEENRNAWHAGDGGNGKGNRKMIAFEICHSTNPDATVFSNSEKLAAKFIAFKLKERGWGIDRVYKHQDFSGKYCPHKTLDLGWERFLNMINVELGKLNVPTANNAPASTAKSYTVKITASVLNVRSGPGTKYGVRTTVKKGEVYTIVDENNGWGKLKSGAGWISLAYTTASNVTKKNAEVEYLSNPNFKGTSIVDALNEIGVDSSKEYRKKLAAKNNINHYTGTGSQNKRMLDKLKAGKLIKA